MFHNLAWDRVDAASSFSIQNLQVNAGRLFRQSQEWTIVQSPEEGSRASFLGDRLGRFQCNGPILNRHLAAEPHAQGILGGPHQLRSPRHHLAKWLGTIRRRVLSSANWRGVLSYRSFDRGLLRCVKDSIMSYSVDIFCWGKSLLPHRYRRSKPLRRSLSHLISFVYRARSAIVQKRRLWPFRCTHLYPARSREQLLFRSRVLTRTSTELGSGGS